MLFPANITHKFLCDNDVIMSRLAKNKTLLQGANNRAHKFTIALEIILYTTLQIEIGQNCFILSRCATMGIRT